MQHDGCTLLVNIDVPDLADAERFYTEAFGLRAARRFGTAALELVGWAAPLYLLVKRAGKPPFAGGRGRDYARHWTPVHLDITVDDLDAAIVRATAAGAVREGDIETHAYGRIAFFADPFGHGFCLLQFSERGYDAIATG